MRKRSIVSVVTAGVVVALLWTVVAWGLSASATGAANRSLAARAAARMLAGTVLPAGSKRSAPQLTGLGQPLARPDVALFVASQQDEPRFWTTSATPLQVLESIAAHLPAGAKSLGQGSDGGELDNGWALPAVDRGRIVTRQLVVMATPQSDGTTIVRADAEVQYIAPRPVADQIPATARVLQVTETGSVPTTRHLALTVTAPATVRRIAATVDGLPFEGNDSGVAFSCPAELIGEDAVTFSFRASAGGPVLATVSLGANTPTYISPCQGTTVTIGRRSLPPLMQGGILLQRAGAILHVKLTAS